MTSSPKHWNKSLLLAGRQKRKRAQFFGYVHIYRKRKPRKRYHKHVVDHMKKLPEDAPEFPHTNDFFPSIGITSIAVRRRKRKRINTYQIVRKIHEGYSGRRQ